MRSFTSKLGLNRLVIYVSILQDMPAVERVILMASRSMVVADPVATCSQQQPIISFL